MFRKDSRAKKEKELIKVLDILLQASDRNSFRKGRQIFSDPELEGFTLDQARSSRQAPPSGELDGFARDEICERTGFETRKSEECQVSYEILNKNQENCLLVGGERNRV